MLLGYIVATCTRAQRCILDQLAYVAKVTELWLRSSLSHYTVHDVLMHIHVAEVRLSLLRLLAKQTPVACVLKVPHSQCCYGLAVQSLLSHSHRTLPTNPTFALDLCRSRAQQRAFRMQPAVPLALAVGGFILSRFSRRRRHRQQQRKHVVLQVQNLILAVSGNLCIKPATCNRLMYTC